MKKYEELTFTDDFMFCRIMQYNEDICRDLVELIIGKKIGEIISNDRQRPIEITPDGRGVRMDVYLEDDKDTVYNIEMQNANLKDLPKRARYYQSMIDVDMFERGGDYKELKRSYIIFINTRDPFDKKLPVYTVKNQCLEDSSVDCDDGVTKLFVNARSTCGIISDEMRAFLNYLSRGNADSTLTHRIDEKILEAKQNAGWKGEFMTLYEHYQIEREEGREIGDANRLVVSVDALIKSMKLSIEEACKVLNVSVQEYNEAKKLI
ncbi:MAG: Rpn family recombination-promoting nuclease/putative transposase [Clostridiales bacterium]|nr:Rpn family recombination-promoting nuclease/putative transposase [Candidatus Crickella equi]